MAVQRDESKSREVTLPSLRISGPEQTFSTLELRWVGGGRGWPGWKCIQEVPIRSKRLLTPAVT